MKNWQMRRLGELILPTEQRDPRLKPTEEFFYVDIAGVDNEAKTIATPNKIVGAAAPSRARKVIHKGDVIVSTVRPQLNAVAIVPAALDNQICSTGFSVLRPSDKVLSGYLFAFVRSPFFIGALVARTTGANYPAVNDGEVKEVPVPVPPLKEQERIVKLLDEADELRKLRSEADRRTSTLIPALFHDMFGDPLANSKRWPLARAGELMEACDYGTSQKANEAGLGTPILRMGNVTEDGRFDLRTLKWVELSEGEVSKQLLRAGDILFNRTNSRELVGKTGMWDGRFDAVAASYFIRVRVLIDCMHPVYFTALMNTPAMKRRLFSMARGAIGQANINAKELKSIEIPVPPLALQRSFADKISGIGDLESKQTASRLRIDDLFHSILHRAFSGEF